MVCLQHPLEIYAARCPQQAVSLSILLLCPHFKTNWFHVLNWICCVIELQAHEQFEEPKLEAVRENNVELVQDILKELSPIANSSQAADELVRILKEPHFQVRAYCCLQTCGLSV